MKVLKKMGSVFNPNNWPHPGLGKYCGAPRKCDGVKDGDTCPMPETPIDAACAWHDDAMDTDDPFVDWKLAGKWLSVNPFKSENYRPDHQIYDRVYQYGAATTMILVGTVRAPFRLLKKGWRKLRGT